VVFTFHFDDYNAGVDMQFYDSLGPGSGPVVWLDEHCRWSGDMLFWAGIIGSVYMLIIIIGDLGRRWKGRGRMK
jgi:hypothetical protein